jgi:tetratricopeptide (TPR) repeat protein
MIVQQPSPEFIGGIGAALAYWQRQVGTEGVAELDRERHNLYRAVRFGLALPQTQLASAEVALHAFPLILSRGYGQEWLPVLEEALRVCPDDRPWLKFKLLNRLGQLWRLNRQLARSIAAHEKATLLARQLDNPLALAEANYNLGWACYEAHRHEEAEHHSAAVLSLLRDNSEDLAKELQVRALTTLGRVKRSRGAFDSAVDHLQQALAIARERQHDPVVLSEVLSDLGDLFGQLKEYGAALTCYQEAVTLLASTGRLLNRLMIEYSIGVLHYSRQQWVEAEVTFRQIDLIYLQETGNHVLQTMVVTALGNTLLYQGRPAEAAEYLRQTVAWWRQTDDELELANAIGSLGEAVAGQGERQEATALFAEALALLAKFPDNARAKRLRTLFRTEQEKLAERDAAG